MSGNIPDGYVMLDPEEYRRRCDEAADLIKKLGTLYPFDKLVTILHDHEYDINLLQLFMNGWISATEEDDNPGRRLDVIRTVTQAAFVLGYEYRRNLETVDNKLPDSISSFMKDLLYESRET